MTQNSESIKDEETLLRIKAELAEALHQKALLEAQDNFYVFAKMLARKRPPDDWNNLLAESRKSEKRSAKARSAARDAV